MAKSPQTVLEVAGREVAITNPDKVFFPQAGHTKLDLVKYYAAVADGALRGISARPIVLKRYVNGAESEPFFQKRAPDQHPDWIETVELAFPSGRTAREIVVRDAAQLLWIVNLGCIDLNPHPVRADDLEHPDELRVDLDPGPGTSWDAIRRVALIVRDVLTEHQLRGWPKTSGSRGMHVYVRIERRWSFDQVRRATLALAREVERRAPELATSKWWKEERHGVFLDYNQNAKDRTVASAWSVRPTPDARVSMPLEWDEVAGCDPATFTLVTAPARLAERGDASAAIDAAPGSLDRLLELSAAQEAAGRRAVAAALQEAERRAAARGAVAPEERARHRKREPREDRERPAPVDPAAHHGGQGATQGGRARGPRTLEGAPPGGRGAPAGGRRPRRLDARPLVDVDADPGELAACPRERARRRGGARPRLRSLARCRPGAARVAGAEDALQLVGRCDLQLIVAAVPWLLVRAPAHELRGVA